MWGPILGAGIGAIGSIIGGNDANNANRDIMNQNLAFQREMSSTAYQRAVADMRAAGINPMLAAQVGGASTPPGATAQMQNVLGPAVSSAMQTAMATTQLDQLKANVEKTMAETQQVEAGTKLTLAQAPTEGTYRPALLTAQTGLTEAQTGTEQRRPGLIGAQTAEHSARAVGQAQENQRFNDYGPRTVPADLAANTEHTARRAAAHGATLPNRPGAPDVPAPAGSEVDRRNRARESSREVGRSALERLRSLIR